MPALSPTADKLLEHYLYQKDLALERAKIDPSKRSRPGMKTAAMVWGDAMEKMAAIVDHLSMDPGLVMEAVFAYARSMRHHDGPQKNMLGSERYILQAMGFHLELPTAAVRERSSKEYILEKMETDAKRNYELIRQHLQDVTGSPTPLGKEGAMALSLLVGLPIVYRFVVGVMNFDAAEMMIPEVLEAVRTDRRQAMWLASKGWTFESAADFYNKLKLRKKHA